MALTNNLISFSIALVAGVVPMWASAAEPLRVGMVLPLSGPYATYGQQMERGARVYLKQHGNLLGGRQVELILKDDAGDRPDQSVRAAQELLVTHKVDILAGFGFTASAVAVAPLASASHTPMVVMNAGGAQVPAQSNYIVRVSHSLPQVTAPLATWSAMHGVREVFTLVSDDGPGRDAEAVFKQTFQSLGGKIVGGSRTPATQLSFDAVLPKILASKADTVFLFVPPGAPTVAFTQAFAKAGLNKAGVRVVATGDLTEEGALDRLGNAALGLVTSQHYAESHKTAANQAFVKAYSAAYPTHRPNYMTVAGYDGLQLIDKALRRTGGDATGDKFMAAAKGISWTSPRGTISIDPGTRDVVQTVYIRKVEKVDGRLQNVAFDKVSNVAGSGR